MRNTTLPEDAAAPSATSFTNRAMIFQTGCTWQLLFSHQSKAASLVTSPLPEQVRFKHLELIATHSTQILQF
jgi:hypothetical protein